VSTVVNGAPAQGDKVLQELVSKLLIELGVSTKAGQILIHMDGNGLVQQVETRTYRKVKR
jgi:hypothetical protein